MELDHLSRRSMLMGATGAVLGGIATSASGLSATAEQAHRGGHGPHGPQGAGATGATYRPAYHLSVPRAWKNDPQRPIRVGDDYLYYYLANEDYLEGGGGTAWRLATTRDHVRFDDQGIAIPKLTNANGDCWSGSVVVDEANTAGYGAGAVVAILTQAPNGVQAQYLWVSTDGGRTFQPGPAAPVLPNPGVHDFRDPKVVRDDDRDRWCLLNAEGDRIGIYASTDLHAWTRVGEHVVAGLGLVECPDLFRMRASDGTRHWVLGTSANGKARGLPATYAYWVGHFDGATFTTAQAEPRWLDHGFDFYGAVTYDAHDASGAVDETLRRAIGWANFWDYPHNAPSLVTDAYNGDDMIVRELRLHPRGGAYVIASQPPAALADHVVRTHALGDVVVDGTLDLDVRAVAYELRCQVRWDVANPPANVGVEVRRAPGGGRHVALGATLEHRYAYVNRRPTFNPTGGESQTPIDPGSGTLPMRVLVDRASVELFVGDGSEVHSHRVFPLPGDDRIRLYAHGGSATFATLEVVELRVD